MINEHLENMLNNVNEEYDKSEGSLFYDALAPASIVIDETYKKAMYLFDMSNPMTAQGEYLDLAIKARVGDRVSRKQATKAKGIVTIKGIKGVAIAKGTKVSCEDIIFETTKDSIIADNVAVVPVECIQAGTIGNLPAKTINAFPATIQGLQEVINNEATSGGFEKETDTSFLDRYLMAIRVPATSGNVYHYEQWTTEVAGVGAVRVLPLWAGNGTVKLIIVNSNMEVADETLINRVINHIESVRPIGATVTVVSAKNKTINIKAKLNVVQGAILQNIIDEFAIKIKEFLKQNAFKTSYVSLAKIGNILLETTNVLDYRDLRINNAVANVELANDEIVKAGAIELQIIT